MIVDLTQPVARVLVDVQDSLAATRAFDVGYPGAFDLTFADLGPLLTSQLLNNIGDPYELGHARNHTKLLEQEVVGTVAGLFRARPGYWGYVTTGSSEGNLHALDEAWQRYADVVAYASTSAHYSVAKYTRMLKLPLVMVRATETGEMDYDDLAGQLGQRSDRAAVIVATAGTTMTEAVDDVARIVAVCDRQAVTRRRIHVDAALSGIPLALLPEPLRPSFDFASGATSMVVSGHKFLSTLMPCGILIYARSPYAPVGGRVTYIGSTDTTVVGSRSGHTPAILWHVLRTLGRDGLRARAEASRRLAAYAHQEIGKLGWQTRLNQHAFTVVLRTPPWVVRDKWVLADDGQWSHIVCVPGITVGQIDEFVADLSDATSAGAVAGNSRVPLPRQPWQAAPVAL